MSCLLSISLPALLQKARPSGELAHWVTTSSSTFGMIAIAEIGDKSQVVCMTLAARHKALPIVLGASAAFAVLNLAAVLFGAAAAHWLPEWVVGTAVSVLFAGFGVRALLNKEESEGCEPVQKSGHSMFATTFLLIFAAEFGDKTQLTLAGLGAALPPAPVWLGGTLALAMTSLLGVWAGRALLRSLPMHWLHRLSGVLFLGFAAYAAWRLLPENLIERLSNL
jgi:putative Ca2+/H+ antiporter (TMEM165/GDT1 family)